MHKRDVLNGYLSTCRFNTSNTYPAVDTQCYTQKNFKTQGPLFLSNISCKIKEITVRVYIMEKRQPCITKWSKFHLLLSDTSIYSSNSNQVGSNGKSILPSCYYYPKSRARMYFPL